MGNIFFEDAVTAANLNRTQTHAVYYADGLYANHWAVAQACPLAKLFGITVTGDLTGPGIFAIDSETGDASVTKTLWWVAEQMRLNVELICVYANRNRWLNEGLLRGVQALESLHGRKVKKWDADYDGIAAVPSWADAEQYSDPGPVDLNVALANFFGDTPPAPKPTPPKPFGSFNQAFNGGFQRGFVVGWDRRRHRPLPAYAVPAGWSAAYNLGFRAGFLKGWLRGGK